jgi:hypothetical protein
MKKQSTNAISKKVFSLFLAASLLCASSQSLYANDTANKGAEISYKGLQDKNLVFNINYKNELAEAFELVIKNDHNEVIYLKQFDAKPLNTTLLFTEVPEQCTLSFIIRTGKKEVAQLFEIDTQVKTVQEYVVKGL